MGDNPEMKSYVIDFLVFFGIIKQKIKDIYLYIIIAMMNNNII